MRIAVSIFATVSFSCVCVVTNWRLARRRLVSTNGLVHSCKAILSKRNRALFQR